MPEYKVETLYSGTEVGIGSLCARVCFFCAWCSGTKCEQNLRPHSDKLSVPGSRARTLV